MKMRLLMVLICIGLATSGAQAANVTLSGHFNDTANGALVGSDLGPALFGNDNEIANNVAIYALPVPVGGNVTFNSHGYAAGGAEPYFTLFQGTGHSATFLDSNYSIFDIDFSLTRNLAAGDYLVALGTWSNMSFAENYGTGTLGDGFIGLGVPSSLGNSYYELSITMPDGPNPAVPEPSTMFLLGAGVASLAAFRKKLKA